MRNITMRRMGGTLKGAFIALLIVGLSVSLHAQTKETSFKKPSLVGYASVDQLVNSSFDVYERNQKLTEKSSGAIGNETELKKSCTLLQ